jgi:hypothetical protein
MRRASRHLYSAYAVNVISPRNVNPPRGEQLPQIRRPMADNTEWFEGRATDEAKNGRIIIRSWVAMAAALAALLFSWLMP